jgi:hypothetical protein
MTSQSDEFIEKLILEGAIEVAGIDSVTGEFLFSFTDKLRQIDPEMYYGIMESFHQNVMKLWEKGFVNINMESDNPKISLNEKALDDSEAKKLDPQLSETLREVMRMMRS